MGGLMASESFGVPKIGLSLTVCSSFGKSLKGMPNLVLASSSSSSSSGLAIQNPKPCSITRSLSSRSSLTATRLNPYRPRTRTGSLSLKCRHSHHFESQPATQEQQRLVSFSSGGGVPPRVFVGHSIYKGKAALTVEPRPPEFVPLESGAFKLAREGYVLLQFAPAAGIRQYDWSRKQVFSLSVTEIGTLISLGARESCDFFHDPFKGKSDEGKVRKVLKVEPLPDGSGHFFNLSVQNKLTNVDDSIYIPITKAEYTVLTSAFNFAVPYLLGWHTFANSIWPEDINHRCGSDFEWSR